MGVLNSGKDLTEITAFFDPSTPRGLRFLTGLFVLSVWAAFVHAFIAPIDIANDTALWNIGFVIATFGLVIVMLFSDDELYYGAPQKNRWAKAFQSKWPSKFLSKALNVDQEKTNQIWFQEFNKWGKLEHSQHSQYERTLHRGFSCRFIYYVLKTACPMSWISIILLLIEVVTYWMFKIKIFKADTLPARIVFVILIWCVWITVRRKNSPDKLNGVWKRYEEINKLNIAYLEEHLDEIKSDYSLGEDECPEPK